MNINDVNLDLPISEQMSPYEMGYLGMIGVVSVRQDLNNLHKRVETIEQHIINNSVPQYRPPDCNQHLPLGKVLDDLYERIEHLSK